MSLTNQEKLLLRVVGDHFAITMTFFPKVNWNLSATQ